MFSALRQVSGISSNIGRNVVAPVSAVSHRWISKSSEVDTLAKGQQQDSTDVSSSLPPAARLHKGTTLRHKKNFRFVHFTV